MSVTYTRGSTSLYIIYALHMCSHDSVYTVLVGVRITFDTAYTVVF